MTLQACIPMPLQMVIDDVGWRRGRDGHLDNEPFRTGMARDHVPADYQAIADIGRRLQMRPQAAMILGEWDTRNRLRRIPTASWMGEHWDNSPQVGPWMEEAAQIIRDDLAHFEVTLHGLGHEYWQDGKYTRAEWHDPEGRMRPRHEVMARLELFAELVHQHRLGPLPRSYVPCSFRHHFGHPEENFAKVLRVFGITSLSTPFSAMHRSVEPEHEQFGFDHGVITINRWSYPAKWDEIDPPLTAPVAGPTIGIHWPQVLHEDPARNGEVVERWVKLLEPYHRRFDKMLAPHTQRFCSQLVHHYLTRVKLEGGGLMIDASKFVSLPWAASPREPLAVKLRGLPEAASVRDQRGRPLPLREQTSEGQRHWVLELPIAPDEPVVRLRVGGARSPN